MINMLERQEIREGNPMTDKLVLEIEVISIE